MVNRRAKSNDDSKPAYTSLVPAVEQASRILLCLAQDPSVQPTLTDICKRVGIHKSKGYSILNTLLNFGFVRRDPQDKTYSLGTGLLFLSSRVLKNLDLHRAVEPFLQTLSVRTKSTAFLAKVEGKYVYVIAKDEGTQDIGVFITMGHRFPITWGAHGKAITAFASDSERKVILGRDRLYFYGDPSLFDATRLENELVMCRNNGYAVDLGEMHTGIRAVAAPVFGPEGRLIGSLVVMGTFPEELLDTHGVQAAQTARDFSRSIGGVPHEPSGL
ncbi:MAG: IclR family transcriptional regulator [Pseudomonadota bacterium]